MSATYSGSAWTGTGDTSILTLGGDDPSSLTIKLADSTKDCEQVLDSGEWTLTVTCVDGTVNGGTAVCDYSLAFTVSCDEPDEADVALGTSEVAWSADGNSLSDFLTVTYLGEELPAGEGTDDSADYYYVITSATDKNGEDLITEGDTDVDIEEEYTHAETVNIKINLRFNK